MQQWKQYTAAFIKNKAYMLSLSLTALFSYGFLITHQTVGIDDTPYAYYFEEGLNAIVGRWFLFLLNKICHISDFSPFLTDLAGVLLFMGAVTVWAVLLYSIFQERVPRWGYLFFSCIFLSCPLISEVYPYYLHNGISIGYLCTGVSLCFYKEMLGSKKEAEESGSTERTGEGREDRKRKISGRQRLWAGLGCVCFLWMALGCYESFMVVWLLGICLVLLSERYVGVPRKICLALGAGAVVAVAAILLRSLMIQTVTGVFGLGGMRDEAVQRSVTEMASWMLEPGALSEFAMVLKRIYVMYGVFAYAYYPIYVFVLASAVLLLYGIYRSLRQKDGWIFLLTLGGFVVSFLLVVVEGKATLYRSAQFLPVICGYGAFLAAFAAGGGGKGTRAMEERESLEGHQEGRTARGRDVKGKGILAGWEDSKGEGYKEEGHPGRPGAQIGRKLLCKGVRGMVMCILAVILWNQCYDMNRWFYVDYLKYESAKDTMRQVAYELGRGFDTGKPVVFTGSYQVPRSIIADAYVGYGTETFYQMNRLTQPIDEHLLEKFYREYGVWVAQTPALSVIEWGRYAFGDDSELVRFFAMHGYGLVPYREEERYYDLELYSLDLPRFPQEGSIVDVGECIVVHF